jgi:ELWxxDGT repeat protein
VYFGHGTSLWRADETTVEEVSINVRMGQDQVAVVGGRLYFAGWHKAHGVELWSTDGTAAGARLVADLEPGRRSGLRVEHQFWPAADVLYVSTGYLNGSFTDRALWRSDGTVAGTRLIVDRYVAGRFGGVAGTDLFLVTDQAAGAEPWGVCPARRRPGRLHPGTRSAGVAATSDLATAGLPPTTGLNRRLAWQNAARIVEKARQEKSPPK